MMVAPRLLRTEDAAAYCGVSPSLWAELVKLGTVPKPIELSKRVKVWDRAALDRWIDTLGHVRDGWLCFDQTKTGERVEIPILAPLADAIAGHDTEAFLTTQYGRPFTVESFGNWFRQICRAAGVYQSAHGVRKALGGVAADFGCSEHEIMALLGHTNPRTSAIYTRSAHRRSLASAAMEKIAGCTW